MSSKRIGVISDIHANLHALHSVINNAKQQNVEEIWNAGDSVGYGAFPNEVIEYIFGEGILSIRGNYDSKVLKVPKKKKTWENSKNPLKWHAIKWAYDKLTQANKTLLAGLPEKRKFVRYGWNILLLHGSPASSEEPLLPNTPDKRFKELSIRVKEDIIICGHSHQAFSKKTDRKYFLNPGSVGRQDDGDPRASYGVLDFNSNIPKFEPYRISYDYEQAASAVRTNGLPEEFAQILLTGSGFQNL